MTRLAAAARASCVVVMTLLGNAPLAQTTAGASATIVVPVIAQTASFASEVTAYNLNPGAIVVTVAFYDANNTASPGPRTCVRSRCPPGKACSFQQPANARCRRVRTSGCWC